MVEFLIITRRRGRRDGGMNYGVSMGAKYQHLSAPAPQHTLYDVVLRTVCVCACAYVCVSVCAYVCVSARVYVCVCVHVLQC